MNFLISLLCFRSSISDHTLDRGPRASLILTCVRFKFSSFLMHSFLYRVFSIVSRTGSNSGGLLMLVGTGWMSSICSWTSFSGMNCRLCLFTCLAMSFLMPQAWRSCFLMTLKNFDDGDEGDFFERLERFFDFLFFFLLFLLSSDEESDESLEELELEEVDGERFRLRSRLRFISPPVGMEGRLRALVADVVRILGGSGLGIPAAPGNLGVIVPPLRYSSSSSSSSYPSVRISLSYM